MTKMKINLLFKGSNMFIIYLTWHDLHDLIQNFTKNFLWLLPQQILIQILYYIMSSFTLGDEHGRTSIQLQTEETSNTLLFFAHLHLSPPDSPQPDCAVLQTSAHLSVVRFFQSLSLPVSLPALCPLSMTMIYTSAWSSVCVCMTTKWHARYRCQETCCSNLDIMSGNFKQQSLLKW